MNSVTVSAEAIRVHFDYSSWASARLLAAAAQLTTEELNHDFGTADKSVLGTLAHVFAADRIWLTRIQGVPITTFLDPAERDLTLLQREWPALYDRWKAWGKALTDDSINAGCSYKDMKGNAHQSALWQIGLHVVNHATHHRGQVSGFLRTLGKTPPPQDLIYYYREKFAT